MTEIERKSALDSLTTVLAEKIDYYNECLKNDELFEVRKTLRLQIREIEKQIEELKDAKNDQVPWVSDFYNLFFMSDGLRSLGLFPIIVSNCNYRRSGDGATQKIFFPKEILEILPPRLRHI